MMTTPSGATPCHHRTRWVMIGVRTVLAGVGRSLNGRGLVRALVCVCAFSTPFVGRQCVWAQEMAERVHVLVLFSNDALLPANQILSDSIHTTMEAGAPGRLEFFSESLALVRFTEPEHEARVVGYLRGKYAKVRFDLIFAVGSEALTFEVKYRDTLGLDAPGIFAAVRER